MIDASKPKISFGTNIVFRNLKGFEREIQTCQKSILGPYTADTIVKAHSAFTTDIKVCTAGGIITKDPQDKDLNVVLFHINPFIAKNFDFSKIADKIQENLKGSNLLEGFIVGCKDNVDGSFQMFDNFERFMSQFRIPITEFKGSTPGADFVDVAYNGYKDELTVYDSALGRWGKKLTLEDIPKMFDETKIASVDHLFLDINT